MQLRLRRKRSAVPELEKDPKVIFTPNAWKSEWKEQFGNERPIRLELGCGRGNFISQLAGLNGDINYIAVDKYPEVLVTVLRKLNENNLQNVRLVPMDIDNIADAFGPDEIDKIYINFCNPWPSRKHHKRRLTYPNYLKKYQTFLKPGAEVWFKTDDDNLFADSLVYFKGAGFQELRRTHDLHQESFAENIVTEYELKYLKQGIPIKFAISGMLRTRLAPKLTKAHRILRKQYKTPYEGCRSEISLAAEYSHNGVDYMPERRNHMESYKEKKQYPRKNHHGYAYGRTHGPLLEGAGIIRFPRLQIVPHLFVV
jgi:tRNA (guanine-N7-)-methyltransferase